VSAIEAVARGVEHPAACGAGGRPALDAMRCRWRAKHDEVDQRVRAQAIGAMNRDAGRLATATARDDRIGSPSFKWTTSRDSSSGCAHI